jgi:myo-inositol-1(or 4)-monophosphatase
MQTDALLETALAAVHEAGQLARERLGQVGYRRWKGVRDLVTGSTVDVQSILLERLRASFPDHAILAEESPDAPAADAEALWIVDPIDGTLNFAQGIPHFAISVAFRQRGSYLLGVVYDPCRDELFHAVRGRGSYLNGQPIVVQQVREGIEAYQAAVVGTDWPYDLDRRKEALMLARILNVEITDLVVMGSPALGLCYVGAGRLHAYVHLDLKLWDVAAAAVVVEEAGGVLTNAVGGSWHHSDGGYLATNGIIHGSLLRAVLPVVNLRAAPTEGGIVGEPGAYAQ